MGGSKQAKVHVALLRGINVSGQKKVPMAELRSLAADLGFERVQSYIQSGNLVFSTRLTQAAARSKLQQAMKATFGFDVDIVVSTGAQWLRYASQSPFPHAEETRPQTLLLAVSNSGPRPGAVATLESYAENESIGVQDDALWIDFVDGSGRSKLRPAVLQRVLGPSATTRNWRTVQKLADMVRDACD